MTERLDFDRMRMFIETSFPDRLVVGQRFLDPLTEVRILVGEPSRVI